ncbi:MAG: ATP-binding cassette domain-containing protein [Acidobacteriota bacterium]
MAAVPDLLEFTDLHRRFGRLPVLRGVSGRVRPGEVLLITGSNGSGKSTLLKCLAGLLAVDRGEIGLRLGGHTLGAAERRRRVGYLAPDLAFYETHGTLENLTFFARLRDVPAQRGRELLERVGLPFERPAGALSSGMTQRLRWAWALLHRPRLLLLDEPFQNLDEPGRATARELLQEHLEHGMAVVANPSSLDLPRVASHVELAA